MPASPARPLAIRPPTQRCADLLTRLNAFMSQHVAPADAAFAAHAASAQRWQPFPHMESLKAAARTEGLWNLWISPDLAAQIGSCLSELNAPQQELTLLWGLGLTNVEYAHLAKAMGAVPWCPEVFNCSAPDTGNMEVLARYGSRPQQRRWLAPLLRGDIRSCFAMTEPDVASSDATNIQGTSTSARHLCCPEHCSMRVLQSLRKLLRPRALLPATWQ
jgi:acyl-CoA dehydrogenase